MGRGEGATHAGHGRKEPRSQAAHERHLSQSKGQNQAERQSLLAKHEKSLIFIRTHHTATRRSYKSWDSTAMKPWKRTTRDVAFNLKGWEPKSKPSQDIQTSSLHHASPSKKRTKLLGSCSFVCFRRYHSLPSRAGSRIAHVLSVGCTLDSGALRHCYPGSTPSDLIVLGCSLEFLIVLSMILIHGQDRELQPYHFSD